MSNYFESDPSLFKDLVQATAEDLKIPPLLIEKDYHITEILRSLSASPYREQIVFKGGTSLSKAFQLIDRFSEDIDLAVIENNMSGNQVKMLLSRLMKEITTGLAGDESCVHPSKGSKFRREAFSYISLGSHSLPSNPVSARIIVEISAFANPFPYEKRFVEPFLTTFLKKHGMDDLVVKYGIKPFELNVLSLKQTLCEKIVSLLRFSMSKDPVESLSSKVRHFYDLNALLREETVEAYLFSDGFIKDIEGLIIHDQQVFDEPSGWNDLRYIEQSPIVSDFNKLWNALAPTYEKNLLAVAYKKIPSSEAIRMDFLKILRPLKGVNISSPSISNNLQWHKKNRISKHKL